MRQLKALALFTLGYALMALLSPAVAVLPAFAAFALASFVLLRPDGTGDAADGLARELLRRR